ETAPNCLSNSPKIDRFCSKFASSTPSNVVVGGLTRRSPSPNVDEINTAAVSPKMNETNKNLDVKNNDIDNEVDDRENNSTSFQDNQSLEYSKSSPQKRRRSDCARSNRSRSQSNSKFFFDGNSIFSG
uniref:Uncharacterized protein n=1 Tax=Romanomermis culicivorax TaxID=13658 RepID=A0A915HMA0_ROMCU